MFTPGYQRPSHFLGDMANLHLQSGLGGDLRQPAIEASRPLDMYGAQGGMARLSPFGSIASRNDPNRYGSIASRQFGGLYGPDGATNPAAQQEPRDYSQGMARMQQPEAQQPNPADEYARWHMQDYGPGFVQSLYSYGDRAGLKALYGIDL